MTDMIAHLGLLDDEEIELDLAALELSGLDHEGTDFDPYVALLDRMAEELGDAADGAVSGEQQAAVLADLLFARHGFTGDKATYDAPLNADMIRVLDRRRGLPVSLSILYVAMARRIGWSADALNIPGHVLVRVGPVEASVVIDPFHDGMIVGADALANLLRRTLGAEVESGPMHVEAMSNRQVLVRLLLNQASRAEQEGDSARSLTVHERTVAVAPSNGQGWWELARRQLAAGRVEDARVSLSAMLEITRDGDSRAHISAALEALAGR